MAIEEVISAQAVARYIRMSPTKVRRVLNQIRGCTYEEALIILEFLPYRACEPVWQVVQSAAANVQSKHGLTKKDLTIREVFVSPGPVLKRFRHVPKVEHLQFVNQHVISRQWLVLNNKI